VGEEQNTGNLEEAFGAFRLRVDRHLGFQEAIDAGLAGIGAIVLVPPLRGAPCEHVVGVLRRARSDLPVFALVSGGTSDARAAGLYRRGATAVFSWPLEAQLLPPVLAELLEIEPRSPRQTDADRALQRAIRARLRVLGRADKRLRVAVRNGIVSLGGSVDRLWKKRSLEKGIAYVAGVRSVEVQNLEVEPSGIADRDIARSVRTLLEGVSSIEERTLGVSVHDGNVIVMGTVINREEWLHALELIAAVEGVRSVTNQTLVAPTRKQSDRTLARRLQERLSTLVPHSEEIQIAVLGGVAVLRGKAHRLTAKREAEALVSREGSIARVVNKIEIVPA
jgi:osmotically-inducible protein OsmY